MALIVKINFEERYSVSSIDGLNYGVFDIELGNGKSAHLGIKISLDEHPFMGEVYNLSFGPIKMYSK